jgi:hypothetical protein
MAMYADDNQARLPYGGLRRDKGKHWTWDDLLNQQLGGQFPKKQLEASEPSLDMPVLRCPSDRVAIAPEFVRGHRRTYAMPAHNMADENWPPGPANRTGIGIQWNIGPNVPSPVFSNKWVYPAKDVELGLTPRQLSFTTAMIPRPSKSIAVTEYLKKDNIIGHCTRATVANAAEQIRSTTALLAISSWTATQNHWTRSKPWIPRAGFRPCPRECGSWPEANISGLLTCRIGVCEIGALDRRQRLDMTIRKSCIRHLIMPDRPHIHAFEWQIRRGVR